MSEQTPASYNIYLDTETTDLKPGQILELSMIVENRETGGLISAVNYFFDVHNIEPGAQEAHGFTLEAIHDLADGVEFKDKAEELYGLLSDCCLVAHNEAFDEKFLSMEFWRCGISFTPKLRSCTMNGFKPVLKIPSKYRKYGAYKNPTLSEVLNYLGIKEDKITQYAAQLFGTVGTSFHDSRFDTTALYVATKVYGEKLYGGVNWYNAFCI